jgi:hypothetical protein
MAQSRGVNMLDRNFTRIAATLAALGCWAQAAAAAPIGDIGASCFTQGARYDVINFSPRGGAEAKSEFARGPGLCSSRTMRAASNPAFFTAVAMTRSAQQNICARPDAIIPASYVQRRGQ